MSCPVAARCQPDARATRSGRTIGSIEGGKLPDHVIIDGDPLADIGDLGRVITPVRAGVLYPSAQLYPSMRIAPLASRSFTSIVIARDTAGAELEISGGVRVAELATATGGELVGGDRALRANQLIR